MYPVAGSATRGVETSGSANRGFVGVLNICGVNVTVFLLWKVLQGL